MTVNRVDQVPEKTDVVGVETMNRMIRIIRACLVRIKEDHVSAYAAQAAFFLVLSAFPFLILILTFTRFLPVSESDFVLMLRSMLPNEIEDWLITIIDEMYRNSGNTLMSFSIIVALWSASRGILSISNGLNSVYRTEESRNYFVLRSIATLHTLIVAVAIVVLLIVFVFGNSLYQTILAQIPFLNDVATLILSVRVAVGFVLLFLMFVTMYRGLPNHKISLRQATPGALFSAVSWIIVSFGFSIYVNHFSNYSKVYGSLTGIAIAMVWIYMMMNLILWGSEINVYIMGQYPEGIMGLKKEHARKGIKE